MWEFFCILYFFVSFIVTHEFTSPRTCHKNVNWCEICYTNEKKLSYPRNSVPTNHENFGLPQTFSHRNLNDSINSICGVLFFIFLHLTFLSACYLTCFSQPHLHTIVNRSMELAMSAKEPYNYFLLLRALFRSIGGGSHDLLYQEFLPLLPNLLQGRSSE